MNATIETKEPTVQSGFRIPRSLRRELERIAKSKRQNMSVVAVALLWLGLEEWKRRGQT